MRLYFPQPVEGCWGCVKDGRVSKFHTWLAECSFLLFSLEDMKLLACECHWLRADERSCCCPLNAMARGRTHPSIMPLTELQVFPLQTKETEWMFRPCELLEDLEK